MNKLLVGLGILALTGWLVAYWGWKRPLPSPQTVTKIEYKDRVVVKQVVRETVKPDGTIIKETINSHAKTTEKTSQKAVTAPPSSYMLGTTVTVLPERLLDQKPIYGVQAGYRLGGPLWVNGSLNSLRELTLGLSIEL